ncbi:MAG: hypothetical protein ACO1PW_13500 [Actinomycetota bacterium]
MLHTLAGIAWDPQLRGILATAVGVVVLMGSVHLLLATNVGNRLGFLIAAAGFFGWLTIMGGVWWVYGTIGMLGQAPSWDVVEVLYPGTETSGIDEVRGLSTEELPPADELNDMEPADLEAIREDLEATTGGWLLLPESNRAFGEAKATVDEHFIEHPVEALAVDGPEDYISTYSFERGGKSRLPSDPSRLDRLWKKLKNTFLEPTHPTRYAVIQVHPVIPQEAEPGQPPPTPEADPNAPTISVVMQRDLGQVRLPGAALTIFSGIIFALLCVQLHKRDQRVAEVRALEPTAG